MNMTEEKIAKFTTSILGGSAVLTVLFMIGIFGLPVVLSDSFEFSESPFAQKVVIISILYLASIFLLSTLPGKEVKRRVISWVYSALFHAGLLIYFAIFANFGSTVFILGFVELTIFVSSLWGLFLLIVKEKHNKSFKSGTPQSGAP